LEPVLVTVISKWLTGLSTDCAVTSVLASVQGTRFSGAFGSDPLSVVPPPLPRVLPPDEEPPDEPPDCLDFAGAPACADWTACDEDGDGEVEEDGDVEEDGTGAPSSRTPCT
jgi:hypothetical protein